MRLPREEMSGGGVVELHTRRVGGGEGRGALTLPSQPASSSFTRQQHHAPWRPPATPSAAQQQVPARRRGTGPATSTVSGTSPAQSGPSRTTTVISSPSRSCRQCLYHPLEGGQLKQDVDEPLQPGLRFGSSSTRQELEHGHTLLSAGCCYLRAAG